MTTPSPRTVRLAKFAAVPVALLISGLVVGQASYAAYSDATVSPASNWSSGTVKLADDDNTTALFSATNLKPGATGSKCIAVTSTGTLASTVKLYGTGAGTTNGLSSQINLTVTQGTGATFSGGCGSFTPLATGAGVYDGTLAAFATANTNFTNGRGTWAPTGTASETRVYKFDYTLSANAPDTSQGGTATIGFTWEAQNS